MNEDEVVQIVRGYIESLFPRSCPTCGRSFTSLREYLQTTTHLGNPVLYDPMDSPDPPMVLGPMSLANCTCGTTLTISSRDMPLEMMVELMSWGRVETERRGIDMRELLNHIRDRIDAQVLAGF